MRISFDLDDTIIAPKKFPLERETLLSKIIGTEKIRLGTIELFKELKAKKHEIYIYTTSHRSKTKVKLMFWTYGIPVDFVINQQLHKERVLVKGKNISKFPPEFDIDIHIDDSLGVEIEGHKFGFKTIITSTEDENWSKKVIEKIEEITNTKN